MKNFARRIIHILPAALFLALALASGNAHADEAIKHFDVAVALSSDSTMTVTEALQFSVERHTIRHGIIRDFPVYYKTSDGGQYSVPFEIADITLDGKPVRHEENWSGNYVHIKIGSERQSISRGLHTFKIIYRTGNFVGFFDDHDELYWNVTGQNWQWPIEEASFRLSLAGRKFGKGFTPDKIEWYTGTTGAKDGHMQNAALKPDNSVVTTKELAPGEGLTVVYSWPKGIVSKPVAGRQNGNETAAGIAAFILSLAWGIFVWFRWSKDPRKKPVIPIFTPPFNASSAALRYGRDLDFDSTAFASVLLSLVVKRALKLDNGTDTKSEKILSKTDSGKNLTPEEKIVLNDLPKTLTISKKYFIDNPLNDAYIDLWGYIEHGYPWAKDNSASPELEAGGCPRRLLFSLIFVAAGLAALFFFESRVFGTYYLNMMLAFFFSLVSAALGSYVAYEHLDRRRPYALQMLIGALPAIGSCIFVALLSLAESSICVPAVVMFIAAGAVPAFMLPLCISKRTKFSMDLLAEIEGFQMYLGTAEKERIEAMDPPEADTPELFEKYLPYAYALDTAKTWGTRFKDIIGGDEIGQFETEWLNESSDLRSIVEFAAEQSYSARGSSGSEAHGSSASSSGAGGGGSAGGGGGGGGGSGW
jgi:uncharacterized membrane protein YgcG